MTQYWQEISALTMRWVRRLSREKFSMLFTLVQPMLFWLISASAAIDQQITALIRGPEEERVVWDIPREPLDSTSP